VASEIGQGHSTVAGQSDASVGWGFFARAYEARLRPPSIAVLASCRGLLRPYIEWVAREPGRGANVFRRPPTQRDPLGSGPVAAGMLLRR
jgi:hypothetical protein